MTDGDYSRNVVEMAAGAQPEVNRRRLAVGPLLSSGFERTRSGERIDT
jgi:hypothetical protein